MAGPVPSDNPMFQVDSTDEQRVPKYPMDFGQADSLDSFSNYQFFTPAILYLLGGFQDQSWAQMMLDLDQDLTLMFHRFDRPVFSGITAPDGDKEWNYVLWATTQEEWQSIESYLLSMVFMDKPNRRMHKVGAQDVTVYDPLHLQKHRMLQPPFPTTDVVVLGINGNHACIGMDPNQRTELGLPKLGRFPPQPKIIKFADTLFQGLDNAVDAVNDLETDDES